MAGDGGVILISGATSGLGAELQSRYRLIAYDPPFHGRSLPPVGHRWWEQGPTRRR